MKKASEALLVTLSSVMQGWFDRLLREQSCGECLPRSTLVDHTLHRCCIRFGLWRDNVKSVRTLLICPAAVDTGMFAGVLNAGDWALKISRFCILMLSESQVADTIYCSIRCGDELLAPCFSGWRGIALSWAPPFHAFYQYRCMML
ncbi:hypothetical protein GQ600_20384 [Phytophthora cactorum]|nr:hypothetical protein GQ600_20384 [Phytophthora cactorum]